MSAIKPFCPDSNPNNSGDHQDLLPMQSGNSSVGLSISEMLSHHEGRYCSPANRIIRSRRTGVHVVEVRSNVQRFTAPRCDFHRFNFQLSGHTTLIDFELARQTKRKPGFLVAGNFAFIPCGTEAVAQIEGDPFHVLQVMIPRSQLRRALEIVTGVSKDDDNMTGHIGSAGPAFKRIGQLFHQEYSTSANGSLEMLSCLSEMLCIELARAFDDASTGSAPGGAFTRTEESQVVELLPSAINGTSKLSDIAEAMGLAPYQFTRRFQAHFGESPSQYVLHLRLEQAREMLVQNSVTLPEIAYICGFSSQAHLTFAFSRHFGLPPARYRASQVEL